MTSKRFTIRRLTPEDAEAFVVVRREALRTEPFSFLASEEDDVCLGLDFMRHVLHRESANTTFGAFQHGALVGIVGIGSESKRKAAHKARLMGLYVRHEARGSGIGKALVEEAVAYARTLDGVTHLTLVVSERAQAAQRLYKQLGFATWGREPDAVHVEGIYAADDYMTLRL